MSTNFKFLKEDRINNLTVLGQNVLPLIDSSQLPPPLVGSIAYDHTTQKVYYSNSEGWLPISTGGGSGAVASFSLSKSGTQSISTNVSSIIKPWSSSPPYSLVTGLDPVTGIYTASANEKVTVMADLTWSGGFSNVGRRTIKIVFFDSSAATTTVVARSTVLPSPDASMDTSQSLSTILVLEENDQVWVEAEHTAPVSLNISAGSDTTLSGMVVSL